MRSSQSFLTFLLFRITGDQLALGFSLSSRGRAGNVILKSCVILIWGLLSSCSCPIHSSFILLFWSLGLWVLSCLSLGNKFLLQKPVTFIPSLWPRLLPTFLSLFLFSWTSLPIILSLKEQNEWMKMPSPAGPGRISGKIPATQQDLGYHPQGSASSTSLYLGTLLISATYFSYI